MVPLSAAVPVSIEAQTQETDPQVISSCLSEHKTQGELLDQLAALLRLERTTYTRSDYIATARSDLDQQRTLDNDWRVQQQHANMIDQSCRTTLCDLLYSVADYCQFRRDTVAYAMTNLLDRFLLTPTARACILQRSEYQLAAITALYLAVKCLEPVNFKANCLVQVTRGYYQEESFYRMERDMLMALKWHVAGGPTPLDCCQHYLGLLQTEHKYDPLVAQAMMDHAQYQLELAISDYDLMNVGSSHCRSSHIGMAALWNAMEGMGNQVGDGEQALWQQRLLDLVNATAESCDLEYMERQTILDLQATLSRIVVQSLSPNTTDGRSRCRPHRPQHKQQHDHHHLHHQVSASSATDDSCDASASNAPSSLSSSLQRPQHTTSVHRSSSSPISVTTPSHHPHHHQHAGTTTNTSPKYCRTSSDSSSRSTGTASTAATSSTSGSSSAMTPPAQVDRTIHRRPFHSPVA